MGKKTKKSDLKGQPHTFSLHVDGLVINSGLGVQLQLKMREMVGECGRSILGPLPQAPESQEPFGEDGNCR